VYPETGYWTVWLANKRVGNAFIENIAVWAFLDTSTSMIHVPQKEANDIMSKVS